jgi:drug/metabolite transporter (DMT)-like permease
MPAIVIGIAAAAGASALYAVGIAMQAIEARAAPIEHALRISLFRRLVKRPLWVIGTAFGLGGWALQTLALTRAPLTVVQPLLGASLVFLLVIAALWLHEPVRRRDAVAVVAIAAGVPLLALTAPHHSAAHAGGVHLWVALGVLGALAAAPLALRGEARAASILVPLGAGLAYSWDGLATKFASDDYLGHAWIGIAIWFVAMNAASGLGTLSEMSALQRRRVTEVAPIIFSLTTFVPVGLAPLLAGEPWSSSPLLDAGLVSSLLLIGCGAVALARSAPVARTLAAEATSSSSGTGRRPLSERNAASAVSESRARA